MRQTRSGAKQLEQRAKARNSQAVFDPNDPRFGRMIRAFGRDGRVSQTKMFGSVGLKVNGKVFAIFYKGKFVAKLPRERIDTIVALGQGEHFDPGPGRPSKEWER